MKKIWGQLLSLDLSDCEPSFMNNPKKLKEFSKKICKEIDMVPFGKPIVHRFGEGTLEGYSMMQFIMTSSITVHLDEINNRAFIDIFSCKKFDANKAKNFCKNFFRAKKIRAKNLYRY
jgi:S-adenosylmethionine/arginine decarboxylase-like enzyme